MTTASWRYSTMERGYVLFDVFFLLERKRREAGCIILEWKFLWLLCLDAGDSTPLECDGTSGALKLKWHMLISGLNVQLLPISLKRVWDVLEITAIEPGALLVNPWKLPCSGFVDFGSVCLYTLTHILGRHQLPARREWSTGLRA